MRADCLKESYTSLHVVPFPMLCDECARIKGPVVHGYNHLTHSKEKVCLECYSALAPTGCFDHHTKGGD